MQKVKKIAVLALALAIALPLFGCEEKGMMDETTGVSIVADKDVFPKNTKIKVQKKEEGLSEKEEEVVKEYSDSYTVYDISALSGGQTVQPNEDNTFSLLIPAPSNYSNDLAIFCFDENGNYTTETAFRETDENEKTQLIIVLPEIPHQVVVADICKENELEKANAEKAVKENEKKMEEEGWEYSKEISKAIYDYLLRYDDGRVNLVNSDTLNNHAHFSQEVLNRFNSFGDIFASGKISEKEIEEKILNTPPWTYSEMSDPTTYIEECKAYCYTLSVSENSGSTALDAYKANGCVDDHWYPGGYLYTKAFYNDHTKECKVFIIMADIM